jgi:hypothetical protein
MGNIKHRMGAIGGGINLSKSKTPHDADIKYDPINDRADSLSPLNQTKKATRLDKRNTRREDRRKRVDTDPITGDYVKGSGKGGTDVGNYLRGVKERAKQYGERSRSNSGSSTRISTEESEESKAKKAEQKAAHQQKILDSSNWETAGGTPIGEAPSPATISRILTGDIKLNSLDVPGSMKGTPLEQSAKGSDASYGISGYVTNRKDLKQARKKYKIKNLSLKHEKLKGAYDSGQKVNENQLFNVEDKLNRKEKRYVKKYGNSPYSLLNNILKK